MKAGLYLCLILSSAVIHAQKLVVVTTIPDLAEIVREVGQDQVEVISLLNGSEDPHFLDASPDFIKKLARADAVCFVGLDLEVGWLPKVLQKSNNAKVQSGGLGYCDTGSGVQVLEKPSHAVDRSMGDVHGRGNPHFYLSPDALSQASEVVAKTLSDLRPQAQEQFAKSKEGFQIKMADLKKSIALKLKSQGSFIEYHKEFTYFFNAYGLKSIGSIEELPGVPPSIRRLAEVAKSAKSQGVKLAIGASYTSEKHLKKFSELSGIPFRQLPAMVQTQNKDADTIFKLQNFLAEALASK